MRTDQEMLQALEGLLSIPSVAGESVTPEAPFGAGVAEALTYTLTLCQRLGMRTVRRDGQVAWAEIGSGSDLIAVVPHVDVVPAGDGWTVPPFACTERSGRLYGRGASDNKGPAIACVFATADLLERGIPLSRRIRLIFGQCEETGHWADMEYYRAHEEPPMAGFTPDAEFPALSGEKGMLWAEVSAPMGQGPLLCLEGGDACNMVPAWCRAVLSGAEGEHTLQTQGTAAHATVPEAGVSAIDAMMALLSAKPGLRSPLVDFYQTYLAGTFHGEKLGCYSCDAPSGATTVCASMARTNEQRISLSLDIRYPVTADGGAVRKNLESAAAACGLDLHITKDARPLYRSPSHPVLREVLAAYREETGDCGEPLVIGGGTYARALDNLVGFGAAFPGRQHTEHQKDEYILREDFFRLRSIYRTALMRLLRMDLSSFSCHTDT